jgi:hypothetical protein
VEMDLEHPCRVDPRELVHTCYSPKQGTCGKIKLH